MVSVCRSPHCVSKNTDIIVPFHFESFQHSLSLFEGGHLHKQFYFEARCFELHSKQVKVECNGNVLRTWAAVAGANILIVLRCVTWNPSSLKSVQQERLGTYSVVCYEDPFCGLNHILGIRVCLWEMMKT